MIIITLKNGGKSLKLIDLAGLLNELYNYKPLFYCEFNDYLGFGSPPGLV